VRELLESLEQASEDERRAALAYVAGQRVPLDPEAAKAAIRRALLLLVAGGDPHRGLAVDGRAVRALAADLDAAQPRAELAAGLEALRDDAAGLPNVTATLDALLIEGELAWRFYASALLADELD
jgi:hypothetical protein